MRYTINFYKMVNQLVPYYIGGRKLILYLHSLMKPLQILNDAFVSYAKETRIESSVTSQKIYFEWYLNRKLGKYLKNKNESITITRGVPLGVVLYHQNADIPNEENPALYGQTEDTGNQTTPFYYYGEAMGSDDCSFIVLSPAIDEKKIEREEYESVLSYYIDKYRISGKTYKIKIDE